jgi:hypothetical protein
MPLLDGGEEPLEVIIVFAPLDLDAERSRDLLQELDAEAASMSVVGVDGEWGACMVPTTSRADGSLA